MGEAIALTKKQELEDEIAEITTAERALSRKRLRVVLFAGLGFLGLVLFSCLNLLVLLGLEIYGGLLMKVLAVYPMFLATPLFIMRPRCWKNLVDSTDATLARADGATVGGRETS